MKFRIGFVCACLGLTCAPAGAAPPADTAVAAAVKACNDSTGDDATIDLCTRAIATPGIGKLDLANAYADRAMAYSNKKNIAAGMADANAAIKLAPNADNLIVRGILYDQSQDFDHAIADYNRALKLDPKNVSAFMARGYAYTAKGSQDLAMSDFRQCLALDSTLANCKTGLDALTSNGPTILANQLLAAAKSGNSVAVNDLLAKGAGVKARDDQGRYAIHYAAENGMGDAVTALLHHGAGVDDKDQNLDAPIDLAVKKGDQAMVKLLLQNNADGRHALLWAARDLDLPAIRILLGDGIGINVRGNAEEFGLYEGATPLVTAVDAKADLGLITFLLDQGADVNAIADIPNAPTALHLAAMECNASKVQLLLSRGANRSAVNRDGETPYKIASSGWTYNMQPCGQDVLSQLQ